MKKVLLAGIAALTIAGSTAVYAQHRPWFHSHTRMSPEDRAAFLDARIAAVHAGLKLSADQEKLWPPVETAVRDFAKMGISEITISVLPWLCAMLVFLGLITYVPEISLWLPRVLGMIN